MIHQFEGQPERKSNVFDYVASGICLSALFVWSNILLIKYLNFGYYDWDLAYYSQMMWQIVHGSMHVSLLDYNLLGEHSNLIAYLIAPLYVVFPHPFTLLFLKALSYTLGSFFLYVLAKRKLKPALALLIMFLFLIYPANIYSILYEFHFESIAPAFLFLLVFFYEKSNWLGFILTSLVTMLIKENMPLIIITFGIYALFSKEKNKIKWAIAPIFGGLLTFYFLVSILIPYFNQQKIYPYFFIYHKYGNTFPGIALTFFKNPALFVSGIINQRNLFFLDELFRPFLYLPVFGIQFLFLGSSHFLQHLLSSDKWEQTIYRHYTAGLTPFIFLALVQSLSYLKALFRPLRFNSVLLVLLILGIWNFYKNFNKFSDFFSINKDGLNDMRWELIRKIPNNVPVIADIEFLAALSMRPKLYSFHKVYYRAGNNRERFKLGDNVNYALVDFNNEWLKEAFETSPISVSSRIYDFLVDGDWRVGYAVDHVILFQKNSQNKPKIIELTKIPYNNINNSLVVNIAGEINMSFEELKTNEFASDGVIPLTFYWQALKTSEEYYSLILSLKKDGRIVDQRIHDIGYAIYPTLFWKKGDNIKEKYWYHIPRGFKEGVYNLEVSLMKGDSPTSVPLIASDPKIILNNNSIKLGNFKID